MGAMKGSAPGTASSVRPALAFGALARKGGVSGVMGSNGEIIGCGRDGEGAHIHSGVCAGPNTFA